MLRKHLFLKRSDSITFWRRRQTFQPTNKDQQCKRPRRVSATDFFVITLFFLTNLWCQSYRTSANFRHQPSYHLYGDITSKTFINCVPQVSHEDLRRLASSRDRINSLFYATISTRSTLPYDLLSWAVKI